MTQQHLHQHPRSAYDGSLFRIHQLLLGRLVETPLPPSPHPSSSHLLSTSHPHQSVASFLPLFPTIHALHSKFFLGSPSSQGALRRRTGMRVDADTDTFSRGFADGEGEDDPGSESAIEMNLVRQGSQSDAPEEGEAARRLRERLAEPGRSVATSGWVTTASCIRVSHVLSLVLSALLVCLYSLHGTYVISPGTVPKDLSIGSGAVRGQITASYLGVVLALDRPEGNYSSDIVFPGYMPKESILLVSLSSATTLEDVVPKECNATAPKYPAFPIPPPQFDPSDLSWDYLFSSSSSVWTSVGASSVSCSVPVKRLTVTDDNLSLGLVTAKVRTDGTHLHAPPAQTWHSSVTTLANAILNNRDTAVINALMYGVRAPPPVDDPSEWYGTWQGSEEGYIMSRSESWSWTATLRSPNSLLRRTLHIFLSTIHFFTVFASTALVVRVLTTSGVALAYPIITFLISRRILPSSSLYNLNMSYPWLGLSISAYQRAGDRSFTRSIVVPHIVRLLVIYVIYELAYTLFTPALLGKSYPSSLPVILNAWVMLSEYFGMIFVRTAESAYFFPKAIFWYWMVFMAYFYMAPYGFSGVAATAAAVAGLNLMFWTIIVLELPKFRSGIIDEGREREVWNGLPWRQWEGAIPGDWTMFMGLDERADPVGGDDEEDGVIGGTIANVNVGMRRRQGGGAAESVDEEAPDQAV